MQGAVRLVAISLAGIVVSTGFGGDNVLRSGRVSLPPAEFSALFAGLDSPEYAARRSATAELEALLKSPRQRIAAESQLRQTPWDTLSLEAQKRLRVLGLLPARGGETTAKLPQELTHKVVGRLVEGLTSDRYLDRARAIEQLSAATARRASIHEVYSALKHAAAEGPLSIEARLVLDGLLDTARHTWLTSGTAGQTHPPSAEQISDLLDALTAAPRNGVAPQAHLNGARELAARRDAAQRELLDALALQTVSESVQLAITTALSREGLDADAIARLRRLQEWASPGLVVESWNHRRNVTIQYFLMGAAAQTPGGSRPTKFNRVEEGYANCEGGSLLRHGLYPLDVAFPHPRDQAAYFHLVSLPTARERLIYQYESESLDDDERLRAITERTLGPSIAHRRPFDDGQLWLLGHLHQPTVAATLAAYFAEVPDEPFDLSQLAPMLTDVSSVHRTACLMLALDGSHEVVPALVEAAEEKRLMSLSIDEPQTMPWIAALAIAARDPWKSLDGWLAGLVECTDRISFGQNVHSEVGATAAAMLLARHGQQPADFGLIARPPLERGLHDRFQAPINADYRRRMFEDRMFKQLGLTPHSFASEDRREAVLIWWGQRQTVAMSLTPRP